MIYLFAALYCEAEPLIKRYGLTGDGEYPFAGFVSEDGRIRLTITGVGKTYAAAAASSVCTKFNVTSRDFLINIGTCAGCSGMSGAYLINKVTDGDNGRTYYPDMLYNTGLRENQVTTLSRIATPGLISGESSMLWEMEASGFCDAARLYAPPDRVQLIKVVSDNGADSGKDITDGMLRMTVTGSLDDIAAALDVYLNVDDVEIPEPVEVSPLAEDFRCSETMRQDLIKLMIYCRNSRRDASLILDAMRNEGLIPAPDRQRGKEALNEFKRRILQ
ncbi:hypothetical protein SAMN02910456_01841 [Ruminococcaceae bacterium YRB3002]|nr:hypothetical protein SAMN02910456_01841 [Ruminococcaceae bacterium YRB3002]